MSNNERVTSLSKVIASSGLGNQLFQFCFAHSLVSTTNKVIFENNPIFAKNRSYMLADFNKICHHLSFKTNINISHTSNFTNLDLPRDFLVIFLIKSLLR